MNVDDLLQAGFRKINDPSSSKRYGEDHSGSYQKRVEDDEGVRYHVTVVHLRLVLRTRPPEEFFCPSVQFSRDGTTFNVDMLHVAETVAGIEAFYDDVWNSMKPDYYDGSARDRGQILALPAPR